MKTIQLNLILLILVTTGYSQDSSFYFRTSDSVSLYVRVAGKGQPCVFVHGGPGSSAYYLEAVGAAPLLEDKLQMIYFDQRGCGRSDTAKNGDYSLHRMGLDLEELRKHLAIREWSVMGHSFGGILVTRYAYDYPKSVRRLLIIHGTLNLTYSMNSHIDNGLMLLGIRDQAPYRDTSKPLMERLGMVHSMLTEKGIWYKLMFRNQYEKTYNDTLDNPLPRHNRDYANKVWSDKEYYQDFTPLTRKIFCPVLVMTGDRDYAIGPDHYRQFHFPHQKTVHYHGGHAPFQEEPQWFSEKVLDFLKQPAKVSPRAR